MRNTGVITIRAQAPACYARGLVQIRTIYMLLMQTPLTFVGESVLSNFVSSQVEMTLDPTANGTLVPGCANQKAYAWSRLTHKPMIVNITIPV